MLALYKPGWLCLFESTCGPMAPPSLSPPPGGRGGEAESLLRSFCVTYSAHTAASAPAMKWLFHILLCIASKSPFPYPLPSGALSSVWALGLEVREMGRFPKKCPCSDIFVGLLVRNSSVLMTPVLRLWGSATLFPSPSSLPSLLRPQICAQLVPRVW